MRLILMDGGRPIFQTDLTPEQGVQVWSYAQSILQDARVAQAPQSPQQLPPDPREEARMRKNARPSNPRGWWVPPDQGDAIMNQDNEGSDFGPEAA